MITWADFAVHVNRISPFASFYSYKLSKILFRPLYCHRETFSLNNTMQLVGLTCKRKANQLLILFLLYSPLSLYELLLILSLIYLPSRLKKKNWLKQTLIFNWWKFKNERKLWLVVSFENFVNLSRWFSKCFYSNV